MSKPPLKALEQIKKYCEKTQCRRCVFGERDDDISCILEDLPPITPQPEHEIDHEYCKDCLHVEMCKWYGYTGCEFRDTYDDIAKKHDRPTGHWIDEEVRWRCSECDWWYRDWKKFKFCPNCGCRMVEPQKRSDKE